jgi:hypothetical protein
MDTAASSFFAFSHTMTLLHRQLFRSFPSFLLVEIATCIAYDNSAVVFNNKSDIMETRLAYYVCMFSDTLVTLRHSDNCFVISDLLYL